MLNIYGLTEKWWVGKRLSSYGGFEEDWKLFSLVMCLCF